MADTGFGVAPGAMSRLLPMHGARELHEVAGDEPAEADQRPVPIDVDRSYPADAAGAFARGGLGLFSTCADYARFLPVLMDGTAEDGAATAVGADAGAAVDEPAAAEPAPDRDRTQGARRLRLGA